MDAPGVAIRMIVARLLSNLGLVADGTEVRARGGRDGAQFVRSIVPTKHIISDQGSYYVASMLPAATVLQLGISAAYSAVQAGIAFTNSDSEATTAKRMYLDFIRMVVSGVPTSATNWQYATAIDSASRMPTTVSNATTNGSGPGTPATATVYRAPANNPNMAVANAALGVPYFPMSTNGGVPPAVPAAGANARILVSGRFREQIPVVGDKYIIQFGAADMGMTNAMAAAPAGISTIVEHHPAVVLDPGDWFLLSMWGASNATDGIDFSEITMGWWEE